MATFNSDWVNVELIIGSDESEELSSFVPANEGEGEGGGVADAADESPALSRHLKINNHATFSKEYANRKTMSENHAQQQMRTWL